MGDLQDTVTKTDKDNFGTTTYPCHKHRTLNTALQMRYEPTLHNNITSTRGCYLTQFGNNDNPGAREINHICINERFQQGIIQETIGVDQAIAIRNFRVTDHTFCYQDYPSGIKHNPV